MLYGYQFVIAVAQAEFLGVAEAGFPIGVWVDNVEFVLGCRFVAICIVAVGFVAGYFVAVVAAAVARGIWSRGQRC